MHQKTSLSPFTSGQPIRLPYPEVGQKPSLKKTGPVQTNNPPSTHKLHEKREELGTTTGQQVSNKPVTKEQPSSKNSLFGLMVSEKGETSKSESVSKTTTQKSEESSPESYVHQWRNCFMEQAKEIAKTQGFPLTDRSARTLVDVKLIEPMLQTITKGEPLSSEHLTTFHRAGTKLLESMKDPSNGMYKSMLDGIDKCNDTDQKFEQGVGEWLQKNKGTQTLKMSQGDLLSGEMDSTLKEGVCQGASFRWALGQSGFATLKGGVIDEEIKGLQKSHTSQDTMERLLGSTIPESKCGEYGVKETRDPISTTVGDWMERRKEDLGRTKGSFVFGITLPGEEGGNHAIGVKLTRQKGIGGKTTLQIYDVNSGSFEIKGKSTKDVGEKLNEYIAKAYPGATHSFALRYEKKD